MMNDFHNYNLTFENLENFEKFNTQYYEYIGDFKDSEENKISKKKIAYEPIPGFFNISNIPHMQRLLLEIAEKLFKNRLLKPVLQIYEYLFQKSPANLAMWVLAFSKI